MTELNCQSCGIKYRNDVQFKTGDDYELPEYEEGQVVEALLPGSTFEGTADAFSA
jgi:hypothetical protein